MSEASPPPFRRRWIIGGLVLALLIALIAAALVFNVPGRIASVLEERRLEALSVRMLDAEAALEEERYAAALPIFKDAVGANAKPGARAPESAGMRAMLLRSGAGYVRALTEMGDADQANAVSDAIYQNLDIGAERGVVEESSVYLARFLFARLRLQVFDGRMRSALATAEMAAHAVQAASAENPFLSRAKWEQYHVLVIYADLLALNGGGEDYRRLARAACDIVNNVDPKAFNTAARAILGGRCITLEFDTSIDLANLSSFRERCARLALRVAALETRAREAIGDNPPSRAWSEAFANFEMARAATFLVSDSSRASASAQAMMAHFRDVADGGRHAPLNGLAFMDSFNLAGIAEDGTKQRADARARFEAFAAAFATRKNSVMFALAAGRSAMLATGLRDTHADQSRQGVRAEDAEMLSRAGDLLAYRGPEPLAAFNRIALEAVQTYVRAGLAHRAGVRDAAAVAEFNKAIAAADAHLSSFAYDAFVRRAGVVARFEASQCLRRLGETAQADDHLRFALNWGSERALAEAQRRAAAGAQEWARLVSAARISAPVTYNGPITITGGRQLNFLFYVYDWPESYPYRGIDDQAELVRHSMSGWVSAEILDAFRSLRRSAKERDVAFSDIVRAATAGGGSQAN